MTTKLTVDKAGRVMIPKPLRQELHLDPGDTLQLDSEGEQITLRPMRPKALLKKEARRLGLPGRTNRGFRHCDD